MGKLQFSVPPVIILHHLLSFKDFKIIIQVFVDDRIRELAGYNQETIKIFLCFIAYLPYFHLRAFQTLFWFVSCTFSLYTLCYPGMSEEFYSHLLCLTQWVGAKCEMVICNSN